MSTLTIRLPEMKHARIRRLAQSRRVSMNKLIDELATVALVNTMPSCAFTLSPPKGPPREDLALLN